MSTSQIDPSVKAVAPELDEAFLQQVDRAVLLSKQRDPYRLEQTHRALEQEVQLATIDTVRRDRSPRRGTSTTDIN